MGEAVSANRKAAATPKDPAAREPRPALADGRAVGEAIDLSLAARIDQRRGFMQAAARSKPRLKGVGDHAVGEDDAAKTMAAALRAGLCETIAAPLRRPLIDGSIACALEAFGGLR